MAWGNRLFTSGNLAIFCKKLNNYIGLHVINTLCTTKYQYYSRFIVWYYLGRVALYDSSEAWGNRLFTSGNIAIIFGKKLNNYIGMHLINTL